MTHTPLLQMRGLTRCFGQLIAVNGIDLSVNKGEVHALIGPNGAGKTTVVNILGGTFPPSSGSVYFQGHDVTGTPSHRLCRLGIGRTFQRSRVLARASVRENVRLGAMGPSINLLSSLFSATAETQEITERVLQQCNLEPIADRTAESLSHGEQRVLEIAMTLAGSPKLLLLDEPLAGTGPQEARDLSSLIRSLSGEHTVILVEHDMDAVFRIADRITVLVGGTILQTGTPEEIRASEDVQEAYLGRSTLVNMKLADDDT